MADIGGYLNIIRTSANGESVRNAIVDCMNAINADSAVKPTNLVITKADNITYKPGTGKAFKSVTVNIDGTGESDPEKTLKHETFNVTNDTENGTYDAPDGTVYGSVNVEIDWTAVEGDVADEATMTFTKTDPTTKMKYWEPEWEDYKPAKRIWIKTDVGVGDEGSGGGSGGTGPFTVTCKALGQTVATIKDITLGDNISSELPTVDDLPDNRKRDGSGKPFSYWNELNGGNIQSVQKNFTVEAIYQDNITGGSIKESWSEIIANGGAPYGIGSTKTYNLGGNLKYNKFSVSSGAPKNNTGEKAITTFIGKSFYQSAKPIEFMIVAKGELGTSTTWLSTTPIWLSTDEWGLEEDPSSVDSGLDWLASNYGTDDAISNRGYRMLDAFFVNMFQEDGLGAAMVRVNKPGFQLSSNGISIIDIRRGEGSDMVTKYHMSKLWLPSFGELSRFVNSAKNRDAIDERYRGAQDYDSTYLDAEDNSIDYGESGWLPKKPSGVVSVSIPTRSCTVFSKRNSPVAPHARNIYWSDFDASSSDLVGTCEIAGGENDNFGSSGSYAYLGFCLKASGTS